MTSAAAEHDEDDDGDDGSSCSDFDADRHNDRQNQEL